MKKVFFILTIALYALLAFTSCKKDDPVEPQTPPNATLKGIVYADLDLSEAGMEFAPAGTKLFFRINASELMLTPGSADYETLLYTTTVGANGEYSISLPSANHQSVNVDIEADDFRTAQKQADDSMQDKVFTLAPTSTKTLADQEHILDLSFN